MLSMGSFERAESLIKIASYKKLDQAIKEITNTLLDDGFDDNDIKQILERITGFIVDDVIEDLL